MVGPKVSVLYSERAELHPLFHTGVLDLTAHASCHTAATKGLSAPFLYGRNNAPLDDTTGSFTASVYKS